MLDMIYASHQLLSQLEATPRDYGTGDLLYASEIHTIVAIGRNPGSNLTRLAELLGVSKPAAFKFVRKLAASKYIQRGYLPDNKKEVSFTLTEKGKEALSAHQTFTHNMFGPLRTLESKLSPSDRETVGSYLTSLIEQCPWR